MSHKSLLIILLVIIVVAGGYFGYKKMTQAPVVTETSQALTYHSATYGFSVTVPEGLTKRDYPSGDVVFGREEGEVMNGVVEVRVLDIAGQPGESFERAISRTLVALCAADGPESSYSCMGVDKAEPFATASGVSGAVLHLTGELKNLKTGTKTVEGRGPFYVVAQKSGATGSRVVVVHAPLNIAESAADAATIRATAESLVFDPAPAE